jgi:Xaa-Pro aminopeptidase
MKSSSLAIFHSNDTMPTNADGVMPFKQNSDMFYLSGIDQEETVLVLFPDAKNEKHRELLFIRETNDHIAIWEGQKLSKEEASKRSGIETIYWTSQLDSILPQLIFECEHIYLNSNEHGRADRVVQTRDDRYVHSFKQQYPLHRLERSAPILSELRTIKSVYEIDLMQQACQITEKAFRRVLDFVEPGIWEFEIEAEILHEFLIHRSRGPAYASIIASGANACVLHYTTNNKKCQEGEVILMDFGAEYANYASDLTRCIPVSGTFSKRQRNVYQAVHRILKKASELLVPGNSFEEYNREVAAMVEKELVELKLLSKSDIKKQDKRAPLYRKYFMHGVSHYLGLDVHDVGSKHQLFQEGMVLTVEPGIYIPEEGLGIRLENDFLITKSKPLDLMRDIPLDSEEIEELMQAGKKKR